MGQLTSALSKNGGIEVTVLRTLRKVLNKLNRSSPTTGADEVASAALNAHTELIYLIRYASCMSRWRFLAELSVGWVSFTQRNFLMATPFFGRRESEPSGLRPGAVSNQNNQSSQGNTIHANGAGGKPALDTAATHPLSNITAPGKEVGSKLTVGPNIKLKGVEITDCDTLVVEGTVEATMDSRVIQISELGAFKGSADIDIAEIHGQFDGNLTVRQKLVIYATGKVIGKIRYGKLVIEEGGQLSGDIQFGSAGAAASASTGSK